MALVPNYFTETVIGVPSDGPDDWTEPMKSIHLNSGFYRSPGQGGTSARSSSGEDSILIEQTKSILNHVGTEIRRDEEKWVYEMAGGPPLGYERKTYSNCYLPRHSAQLRVMETEECEYFAFTPLTDGDNLGRIRRISAYAIYTLPIEKKPATPEEIEKAIEAGLYPGTEEDRIISTGRLWSEANHDGNVVRDSDAPQIAKWIPNVIEEHDVVEEQVDRWIIWTIVKNALKPGDIEVRGPRDIKKTGFHYQFPFPIDPPTIELHNTILGVKVEVKGGGAYWRTPYFRQEVDIPADKYNIYRAKISEPARGADPDLYDWWDTDPPVEERRQIITNTSVTDFDGNPTSALPAQTSYTEPGDVDPPEEPEETVFSLIATVDNENIDRRSDRGYAQYFDEDVVALAEYEYYATAVIADSESPDSNHERIVPPENGRSRLKIRAFDDGRGADAVAPDDPGIADDDYGEVVEFEIPVEDIDDVIGDIAERQFAANEADFQVDIEVLEPILGLQYGQTVVGPLIEWDTYANQIHIASETETDDWMLAGFTLRVQKAKDGTWQTQREVLHLRERTAP